MAIELVLSGVAREFRLIGFEKSKDFKKAYKRADDDGFFEEVLSDSVEGGEEISQQYMVIPGTTLRLRKDDEWIGKEIDDGFSEIRIIGNPDAICTSDLGCEGYVVAFSNETGFSESYLLPSHVTKDNFNPNNLWALGSRLDDEIDVRSLCEDSLLSGTLYYMDEDDVKKVVKEDIHIIKEWDSGFKMKDFDDYDTYELLAELIANRSTTIEKYRLEYCENSEYEDREVEGYFLTSDFEEK